MEAIVQVAFKAVQNVHHVGESCLLKCQAGVDGAFAAAADQDDGARLVSRFAFDLELKSQWVRRQVGVVILAERGYAGVAPHK